MGFLGTLILLIVIGYPFVAYYIMRERWKKLRGKARKLRSQFIIHTMKEPVTSGGNTVVIIGNAVVAPDPLTLFFSKWRHLFGGSMGALTMFAERARLEAEVRMLEQARKKGVREIACVRYSTSDLGGKSSGEGAMFNGEYLCYATGIITSGNH